MHLHSEMQEKNRKNYLWLSQKIHVDLRREKEPGSAKTANPGSKNLGCGERIVSAQPTLRFLHRR